MKSGSALFQTVQSLLASDPATVYAKPRTSSQLPGRARYYNPQLALFPFFALHILHRLIGHGFDLHVDVFLRVRVVDAHALR